MSQSVEFTHPDESVQEAADRLKAVENGLLPVCGDDGRLMGVLTDTDISVPATAGEVDPTVVRVAEIMTPEVLYCFEEEAVEDAARAMEEKHVSRLVVLDPDERVIGVVSLDDLAAECGGEPLAETEPEDESAPDGLAEPNRPNG
jgi:CBS domain-containing protein